MALLGLTGEVGTLLTEHKKWLRDGDAHDWATGVGEDIGDIFWFLAAAASAPGLAQLGDGSVEGWRFGQQPDGMIHR